jgi:PEP-CTERM motif
MRTFKKTARAVLGLSVALLASTAMAETTLTGTYVSYKFDETQLGPFGVASLSGDDLVFTPVLVPTPAFKASSSNGSPGSAYQTVHVTVIANGGYQLSAFNLTESGSYSLAGSNATTLATGNISALDIEGTTSNTVFGNIVATGLGVSGVTTGWTGNAGIALPATGWGGIDGVVTSAKLTIANQLFATTGAGSTAEIWKNAVGLHVVTSPVPEAETYAMMLAGLGLVGFMVRRRNSATA